MPDTFLNTLEFMTYGANSIDEEEGAERGKAAPRAGTAVMWEGEIPIPVPRLRSQHPHLLSVYLPVPGRAEQGSRYSHRTGSKNS